MRTGLHLARLARQIPDLRSGLRVQWLLTRSLQPLYQGLSQHAWSEAQLTAIQHQLAGFHVFADYTNLIHRVVFAHIEAWRAIPGSTNRAMVLPADGGYVSQQIPPLQPRGVWYDHSIQLYNAGQRAIQQVNSAAGRLETDESYLDLNGLPLMGATWEVFHSAAWTSPSGSSLAFAQTSLNQAIIACALERFRLAAGRYPENLNELVPGLLPDVPRDAISGRPIIYQCLSSDSFILRGVGPNALDDRKTKSSDDWLWTYPTNAIRNLKQ